MMLLGTWKMPFDSCMRLSLPPPFRLALTEGCTVTRGFDRCLQVFPNDAWRCLARRVSDLPLTANAARSLRRLIFGAAADLALDDAGALLIPQPLLSYGELSSAAVVVGCDTFFEIWSPDRWRVASERPPAVEHVAGLLAGLAASPSPALL